MKYTCIDCGRELEVPEDALEGEIIGCPDCGIDYVVEFVGGELMINELTIEGEDWGQ